MGVSFSGFELSHMRLLYRRAFRSAGTVYLYPAAHSGGRTNRKTRAGHQCWAARYFALFKNKRMAVFTSSP
ncbi:hypothetical protein KCP73_16815 [Salmonella enterica subsp. enterica]|nr:hypothetical protein KCP73_16815 [Salmonella enterica subsp. enterica]